MLENLCKQTIRIAENTAAYIRKEASKFSNNDVISKGLHNYVTYVDKQSEKMLIEQLGNILPDAGFIAEEGTTDKKSDALNWVIDPLDGTTNFIHGAPPHSISIGLLDQKQNKVVLGVVYELFSGECFYAWQNGGAFLNGNPIQVSQAQTLNDSLIATGFPYTDFKKLQPFLNSMTYLMKNSHGIRRLGSAAIDLVYVACGRYDSFYEYGLHAWDVAAGICIIEEAGGKISDFRGGNDFIFGAEIIASNGYTHDEFVAKVGTILTNDKSSN